MFSSIHFPLLWLPLSTPSSDTRPFDAVDRIGNADRFDYDANGNMTVRNKGLAAQQVLVWDDENRLSQVQDNQGKPGGAVLERR